MNDSHELAVEIRNAIDQVEEAYEFMLAYAAQGRKQEAESEGASQIRSYLERLCAALLTLRQAAPMLAKEYSEGKAFAARFEQDLDVMHSVISLLVAQPNISSDMIDNTNGLIVVRACLTDLFFIDQALLPPR